MTHPLRHPGRLSTMTATPSPTDSDDFSAVLAALRPRLHRYCARMAGSALDGEDLVQDTLAKAALAYDPAVVRLAEPWLFRIAHNTTLDYLRHRQLERRLFVDTGDVEEAHGAYEADDPHAAAETVGAALAAFMHLPLAQRSAVILADVLGHALQEIAVLLDTTVPAVKAALHRGRTRLRELAPQLADGPPALPPEHLALARLYAQRFNARDFDGLRAMLAEEVRLDLAGRLALKGKAEVSTYFGNYARIDGWHAHPGAAEGRAALWLHEAGSLQPTYAIVLAFGNGGAVRVIRDFRYARYAMETLRPS
jgi:RNA polymerase sigma-70 factor (ECF subfamily)